MHHQSIRQCQDQSKHRRPPAVSIVIEETTLQKRYLLNILIKSLFRMHTRSHPVETFQKILPVLA